MDPLTVAATKIGKTGPTASEVLETGRKRTESRLKELQTQRTAGRKSLFSDIKGEGIMESDMPGYMKATSDMVSLASELDVAGKNPYKPGSEGWNTLKERGREIKTLYGGISKDHKKMLAQKMGKIDSPNSIFEYEGSRDLISEWSKLPVEERIKQGFPQLPLKEKFDDPYKALANVPIPEFKKAIEAGGYVTTTGGVDIEQANTIINDLMSTGFGQNYAESHFGGDTNKAKTFVFNYMAAEAKSIYGKRKAAEKREVKDKDESARSMNTRIDAIARGDSSEINMLKSEYMTVNFKTDKKGKKTLTLIKDDKDLGIEIDFSDPSWKHKLYGVLNSMKGQTKVSPERMNKAMEEGKPSTGNLY